MNITIGATLTGGSSVALAPAGNQPGRSTFTSPTHSRLEPETVEFFSRNPPNPTADKPGVATTGLKVSFASRTVEEGCCTVKAGAVIADLGIRWDMSQPTTVVDDVISYLRGIVYTTAFEDAVKKGILPAS